MIYLKTLLAEAKLKLNIPSDIKKLHKLFKKNGKQLYVVGGAVRDAILGKSPKDFDLTTDAKPDEVLDIAKQLEQVALEDDFFKERKLYPNVDFYSGIIYKALGFPIDMFTVLFALGRLPGWIAHWVEMSQSPPKIGRPRQIYTGASERPFLPMEARG